MNAPVEVVGIGEAMGLLDPVDCGPLERSAGFRLRVAGAEANCMIALARLGHRVAFVSAVGDDPFGRHVTGVLAEQGVDVSGVTVDPQAATGVFFKERFADGQRRVYYYRDGSAASRLGPAATQIVDRHDPAVLVVSGVTLGIGGASGLAGLATEAIRRVHRRAGTVVFDANLRPGIWDGAGAAADFARLRGQIDILLAGHRELSRLDPTGPPDQTARTLCRRGMRAVVVKRGARGSTLFQDGLDTTVPPVPVDQVVDPVGAGDAFAAGIVSGMLRGWSLPVAAALGSALGAAVVTRTGDWEGIPDGDDARKLISSFEQHEPAP